MSNSQTGDNTDLECIRSLNWKNRDNINYYENIPVDVLRELAIMGGLETGCDIDLIYEYIATKTSILEVGAAYGRVIRNILERGYSGKLCAIERSANFYKHLFAQFCDKAHIIHADFESLQPSKKVDIVLSMWSGISEFPKEQQLAIIKKMLSWLKPNGLAILDTISRTLIPKNVTVCKNQTYIVHSEYGTAYGYTPSNEEIDEYAKQLGIKNIRHINYKTTAGRDRVLHILSI